jgi:AmmeMemoRadiSam system protein B
MKQGVWQTPLGQVLVDTELAESLLTQSAYLQDDPIAHQHEHSIEVQLPFLQFLFEDTFHIVPICLGYADYAPDIYRKLGAEIAEVIKKSGKRVVVIASSDMSHEGRLTPKTYQERVIKKDKQAIEAILELDEEKLLHRVRDMKITMCGYAPVAAMLTTAKCLGAKEANLIKYTTSFEVRADYEYVVGYAGIIVKSDYRLLKSDV